MLAAGAEQMTEAFKAVGLHDAMYLIPVALFFTMVFLVLASRCFVRDAKRMKDGLVAVVEPEGCSGDCLIAIAAGWLPH
jgi:hypothetical protein